MAYLLKGSGGKYRGDTLFTFYATMHYICIHFFCSIYLTAVLNIFSLRFIFYIKDIKHLDGHHSAKLSEYTVVAVSK